MQLVLQPVLNLPLHLLWYIPPMRYVPDPRQRHRDRECVREGGQVLLEATDYKGVRIGVWEVAVEGKVELVGKVCMVVRAEVRTVLRTF